MNTFDIILLAIGVSMDAFAVAIAKGLSVGKLQPAHYTNMASWFGIFHILMTLFGYYIGHSLAAAVEKFDHWVAFYMLVALGVKMIHDSLKQKPEASGADFSTRTMLITSLATSLDVFAIGVSLSFFEVNIWWTVIIIGIIVSAFSAAGLKIGNHFGARHKSKAEIAGGVILIVMGVKILIEHLCS